MGFVTLILATLGFLSPASRGALLTSTVMIYVLMSGIAGGVAVWMWGQVRGAPRQRTRPLPLCAGPGGWGRGPWCRAPALVPLSPLAPQLPSTHQPGHRHLALETPLTPFYPSPPRTLHTHTRARARNPTQIERSYTGWVGVALQVSLFFPGILMLIFTVLNIAIKHTGSTGAVPVGIYFTIVAIWFLISVPLTFVGGYMATKAPIYDYPVKTNQIPRQIPPAPLVAHPILLFFSAGACGRKRRWPAAARERWERRHVPSRHSRYSLCHLPASLGPSTHLQAVCHA